MKLDNAGNFYGLIVVGDVDVVWWGLACVCDVAVLGEPASSVSQNRHACLNSTLEAGRQIDQNKISSNFSNDG